MRHVNQAKQARRRIFICVLAVILLSSVSIAGIYAYTWRSAIAVKDDFTALKFTYENEPISCSDIIQGALGTVKEGLISTCGEQNAYPLASMTKVLTALVVVNDFGDKLEGKIALDAQDLAFFKRELERNGSNIRVSGQGEYTIKQMLDGMIVASSNNFADSIVTHLYGSLDSYFEHARAFLAEHMLSSVQVGGDASGFDPANRASAKDMLQLGILAMKAPAVRQIVALQEVTLPVFTQTGELQETEKSTTYMHFDDPDAYLGVKSGTSDDAGKNLTFAAPFSATGNTGEDLANDDVLVGVLMGGNDIYNYHNVQDWQGYAQQLGTPISLFKSGQTVAQAQAKTLFGELNYSVVTLEDFDTSSITNAHFEYTLDVQSEEERDKYSATLHIFKMLDDGTRSEIGGVKCDVIPQ